ncbi:hypothetical protein B0H14DRAFT_790008 [Mycena olivaceomarginata]|nr:hypothetical protein B0H14DRAFT_790008 [Mycena olivaceomarginata]
MYPRILLRGERRDHQVSLRPGRAGASGGRSTSGHFSSCSDDVSNQFIAHLDKWGRPNAILRRKPTGSWNSRPHLCWNLRLEMQLGCEPLVGRQSSIGVAREAYAALEWADWAVGEQEKAGVSKQAEGSLLSFVTIRGAGHMVPHDKPEEALAMLSAWLHGRQL